jgi:hypothetical protein
MKVICFVILFSNFFTCVPGQSKNQIKALEIKSTTIIEYDYSSGKENKHTESIKRYNNQGDIIERIDFNKSGKQKERIVYKRNKNFDIVEEIYYDKDDRIEKTYRYIYDGRLKTTKEKYDSNNKLIWRKEYIYEK